MNNKKIAIIHPYIGTINRGMETFFIEIANYLTEYFDITIYSLTNDDSVKATIEVVPCKNNIFHNLYQKFYDKHPRFKKLLLKYGKLTKYTPVDLFQHKFAKCAWKQIKKEKYDLLIPGMGLEGANICKKYRNKFGSPFVYIGGDGIGAAGKRTIKCSYPDMYVALSTQQFDWAKQYTDKVHMIPNGTYIERFTSYQMTNEKYSINKGNKLVIAVGNLDTDFKRHQLVIEAVSRLENVDLLILGRGIAEDELRDLAEEKMPGRCIIKGVDYEETPYYYKSADVFTLASLCEPFGIVYIEAMACGLPVVTTDDSVRREIVEDAGILCDVTNPTEYSNAIKEALAKDFGDIPYKRASLYDYNNIGKMYYKLINQMTL